MQVKFYTLFEKISREFVNISAPAIGHGVFVATGGIKDRICLTPIRRLAATAT
jgi:hypothetical protein